MLCTIWLGIVSSIIGAVIAYFTSYKLIMYISIIPRVINVIIALFMAEPDKSNTAETKDILGNMWNALKITVQSPIMRKQVVADSLTDGIGEATYQIRSEFYKMVWPAWALGIPNALSNVGSFLGNWFSENILQKWGNKKTIIIGEAYSIVSNIAAVISKNVISPLIMVTNSIIPTNIPKAAISQRLYVDEYRSSLGSIKSFFGSIIYAIFAVLIGWMAERRGIIYTIAVVQGAKIIVIMLYNNIFKNNPTLQNNR